MSYDKVAQFQSQLIIGTKQTIKAMKNNEISEVFIAEDVDRQMTDKVVEAAKQFNVPYVFVDSKKKLGKACDIEVGASVAAIRHVGSQI